MVSRSTLSPSLEESKQGPLGERHFAGPQCVVTRPRGTSRRWPPGYWFGRSRPCAMRRM